MSLADLVQNSLLREWINPHYLQVETVQGLQELFLGSTPFPHLEIPEFFNYDKLDHVVEELTEQDFFPQESDLFQLAQTEDFGDLESPILQEFKSFFCSSPFLNLLSHITQVNLSDDIDMMGNIYTDTDYLLCHDDKLPRRKIAYILYLTELDDKDGGSLNLFNTLNGKPHSIVKRLFPRYNQLTFFLVTPISFHEVGEIINPDVYRVSISGWFKND